MPAKTSEERQILNLMVRTLTIDLLVTMYLLVMIDLLVIAGRPVIETEGAGLVEINAEMAIAEVATHVEVLQV